MGYFPPRCAETDIKCPVCDKKLQIRRGCQNVNMHCPGCKKDFPVKDFLYCGDKKMEDFLENVYLDRI